MRKRVVVLHLIVALCLLHAGLAVAKPNPDTGPGCGLGKLAWQDYKGPKQIAPQVMMATTNGTFGSQTFGISFGTSGCTNDGIVMKTAKVQVFAEAMYENLAQDMAQGHGEHLAALASLLGIPPDQQEEFFAMTQARYTALVRNGEREPVAMLTALNDSMAAHPVLAQISRTR